MDNQSIMLISFYNQKALGIRCLEKALSVAGYTVNTVFFKRFNSTKPKNATPVEFQLLKSLITRVNPRLIGLSVMTTLYLETVFAVNKMLKENFQIPILWGGVFPTLFPEKALEHADFVIRGEGEQALVELARALFEGNQHDNIQNLCFKKNGKIVINEMRPLRNNLDEYGYPALGGENKYYIERNRISNLDPALYSTSYELSASRGCPFSCSYCCSPSLKQLYKGKGPYLRFRKVSSIIDELLHAVEEMPNLKYIHFWDEVFPNSKSWLEEFCEEYKNKIGLPFQIWCHPLMVDPSSIEMLVNAGLHKVVMGIQSGSPRIRREIFNRTETQDDIIMASHILHKCKVPEVVYDFILQHPFETHDDIRQTYELCCQLEHPFELQLHGLQFLPGSGIISKAVEMGIMTTEQADDLLNNPMDIQYRRYWSSDTSDVFSNFWYYLIFMTQFRTAGLLTKHLTNNYSHIKTVAKLYKILKPAADLRRLYKKAIILFI